MDKKNTTIGVLLILAAFSSLYLGNRFAPTHSAQPVPSVNTPAVAATTANTATPAGPVASTAPATYGTAEFSTAVKDVETASTVTLQNEFVAVTLTNFGGAVRDVAFKKYPAVKGEPAPFAFNALHADPMLAFVDLPGLDRNTGFEVVSQSPTSVVYRTVFEKRIEVTRRYS
jgi:YidC/Oxa1 family membrane protein insertase